MLSFNSAFLLSSFIFIKRLSSSSSLSAIRVVSSAYLRLLIYLSAILSPCLFNFYSEYIMRKAGLEEAQAGIKIAGRNINNLRYADDTTLMAESDESERGKRLKAQHSENEDHGIRSHHFMGNRWGNSGNSIRLCFGGAPKSLQMVTAAMKLKDAFSLEGKL